MPDTAYQTETPTMYRPAALRVGLTAHGKYYDTSGQCYAIVVEGIDEGGRPVRLSLTPSQVNALASISFATLPESERYQ